MSESLFSSHSLAECTTVVKEKGEQDAIPYVEIGDIDLDTKTYRLGLKPAVKGCRKARRNDILVSKVRPTRGAIAIVKEDQIEVSSAFSILRARENINPRFLWHSLVWNAEFHSHLGETCTGTMYPTTSDEDIAAYSIPLPPIHSQDQIAERLDLIAANFSNVRSHLETIPATLKRFRMSVLAAACSGRLTEDWRKQHSSENATTLLATIKAARLSASSRDNDRRKIIEFFEAFPQKESDGSSIPLSWLDCFVGSVGHVCNGSTPSRKEPSYWGGGIPWVSSGEVQNCYVDSTRESITQAGYDNSSVRLLPKGTVLIAMIGEGKTRGQSAILGIEACINQNMAAIIIDHGLIEPTYLWYWFQSQYDSNREVGSGSGPQALNCQRVRELPLNLPPQNEQVEIVRRIEQMFQQADVIEARYRKAKTFTDKLMPSVLAKAFRGELA